MTTSNNNQKIVTRNGMTPREIELSQDPQIVAARKQFAKGTMTQWGEVHFFSPTNGMIEVVFKVGNNRPSKYFRIKAGVLVVC